MRIKTMTTNANTAPTVENGATVFIPLNKLKKHPKNARKTPHSEASIEAKAASIAAKGILQNLVVEPETNAEGEPTGFYLVSIGEGRRLAQLLRVKRKQIKKSEPIRCVIDTANLHDRAAFGRETLHARRRLGLSAVRRRPAPGPSGHAGHSGRRRAQLSLRTERRQSAVEAARRL